MPWQQLGILLGYKHFRKENSSQIHHKFAPKLFTYPPQIPSFKTESRMPTFPAFRRHFGKLLEKVTASVSSSHSPDKHIHASPDSQKSQVQHQQEPFEVVL